MNRRNLIREYTQLSNLLNLNMRHKARRRMDEIESELEIFEFGNALLISGGTLVTLAVIDGVAGGDRDKFIELEKEKGKNKNYPADSWIKTARIIKRIEKLYGKRLRYELDTNKLSFRKERIK